MELISAPTKIKLSFRVSLLHDLLTLIGLLESALRIDGMSEWIHHEAKRLDTNERSYLAPVNMLLIFTPGVQGYLLRLLEPHTPADTDFSALCDVLVGLDADALQKAILQALYDQAVHLEVWQKDATLVATAEQLLRVLSAMQTVREERWQAPLPPMDTATFADLLLNPDSIRRALLEAVSYVWTRLYHEQALHDLEREFNALHYYSDKRFDGEFPDVFRALTGRYLPESMSERMARVQRVEMLPSSHVGVYVVVSFFDDGLWIGFNAHFTPLDAPNEDVLPVAQLYPVMRALADEVRLKIVALLTSGEKNVGEIAEMLSLTHSTASRHLSLLAKSDVLTVRRDGAMRYYALHPAKLGEVGSILQQLGQHS